MTAYIDTWKSDVQSLQQSRLFDAMAVLAGSLVLAGSAQVSVPMFPVPMTLQTLAVLAIGLALGSRRGALAVAAYLLEGSIGMPFFAGGAAGFLHLIGPTGGYLLAFVPAAYLVGLFAEKGWDRSYGKTLLANALGTSLILAIGVAWLAQYIGLNAALQGGLYPFLLGAVLKVVAGASLLPLAWKLKR